VVLEAEGRKEVAFRDADARKREAEAEAKAMHKVSQAIATGNINVVNYFVAHSLFTRLLLVVDLL
jgi:uncharacterized protein YqfA (UPF0365 family)